MVVPIFGAALGTFNAFILSELPTERAHSLRAVVYSFCFFNFFTLAALVASAYIDVHGITANAHNFTSFFVTLSRIHAATSFFYDLSVVFNVFFALVGSRSSNYATAL